MKFPLMPEASDTKFMLALYPKQYEALYGEKAPPAGSRVTKHGRTVCIVGFIQSALDGAGVPLYMPEGKP